MKNLGLGLRSLIDPLKGVWVGFVFWKDSSLSECSLLATKSKAFFQCKFSSYVILSFLQSCSDKESNELLRTLISLGCLCKQRPMTVFSINQVFSLAKMSTQNFSGEKYGSNVELFLYFLTRTQSPIWKENSFVKQHEWQTFSLSDFLFWPLILAVFISWSDNDLCVSYPGIHL